MIICFTHDDNNNVLSMGTVKGDYIPIQDSTIIEVSDDFDFDKKYKKYNNKLVEITTEQADIA